MAKKTSPTEFDQENQLAIVVVDQPAKTEEPRFYEGTMFGLPREWTVEVRPRKASSKYRGKVDQFFYEPGSRKQFRSLKAVKQHLGLDGGQSNRKRKPKESKATDQFENLNDKEKLESKPVDQPENVDMKNKDDLSSKVAAEDEYQEAHQYFDKTAKRVKWQLSNAERNIWDLYLKVPDSVQQQWMDVFLKPNV